MEGFVEAQEKHKAMKQLHIWVARVMMNQDYLLRGLYYVNQPIWTLTGGRTKTLGRSSLEKRSRLFGRPKQKGREAKEVEKKVYYTLGLEHFQLDWSGSGS
jgi:hypothetical protein